MADVQALQTRFAIASDDHRRRSPFNARLLAAIAERPHLAALLQSAPGEQQLPVLLLAAVHSIVLREPTIELADWYPTTRDAPRTDDPFPAFARLCATRGDEIRTIVATHSTQTNEIGRCALFLPALAQLVAEVGPLGLADIGTSAGLNLQLDRYRYDYENGHAVGDPNGVRLTCGVRGTVPLAEAMPIISARLGVDRAPIDLADPDSVRWLMACVWPDQHDRFERLRAAIDLATRHPEPVWRDDATAALAAAVDVVGADAHPVVLNSWVLNYLSETERSEYLAELDRIGTERDLSWLVFEMPGLCPGIPFPPAIAGSFGSHLVLVRWRDGQRTVEHLAECHPHGYWLHWMA